MANDFLVGAQWDFVVSPILQFKLTREQAINLAAWLAAVVDADAVRKEISRILEEE